MTGINGQILAEFGAKNSRKSAAYREYVSILRKFFPPKSAKYGRLQVLLSSHKKTRDVMKLIFIGSGSAFTVAEHNYNSNMLLIDSNNAEKLLIDCGSDARHALNELGYS